MITPTGVTAEAYWNAIKNGNTTHVRISFTGQNIVLEDEDINSKGGININDVLNSETDLVFGSAVSKQITVAILNSSKLTGLDWAGEFTLEFGVEIGGTTNWVNIGYFKGDKPKNVTTSNVISFTAYDRMRMFDTLADDYVQSITYPATLQNIYDGLCTFVGVQNVQGDELSSSMGRTFASAPMEMEGYACRDLLSLIAEACGCYAKINSAGKVQMVWFSDQTSYALTGNDEFNAESVDASDAVPSVDQVLIKQLDSDMDILYPDNITGQNVYMIVSNPFLAVSQAQDITDYIVPIYNRLNSFGGYLPVSVDCVGNWLVETGDVITVDVKGDDFVVPIFVRNFRWNGAVNDSYESTGNSKREALLEKNKQKILNATEIKLIVKGKYYEKENGIVIDQNGVKVSGSKYIKLDSGGALDVQAMNFIIDSVNQYIKTGNWRFDGKGATFSDGTNDYVITNDTSYSPTNLRGGVYFSTSQNGGGVALHVKKISNNAYGTLHFITSSTDATYLYAVGTRYAVLGSSSHPFSTSYLQYIICRPTRINNMDGKHIEFVFDQNFDEENPIAYRYLQIYSLYNETGGYVHFNSNGDIKFDGPIRCGTVFYDYLVQNSSREVKHDIKKLGSVGDKFDKLEPVTFVYNKDPKAIQRMGLIYEDTVDVMPEICNDFNGEKSINYVELIPALLKEIKDLRKRVAELERRIV